MTLQEWIDNKTQELKGLKYREVQAPKVATEAGLARHSTMIELFTAKEIPMDTEVQDLDRASLPDTMRSSEYAPGAQVVFRVIKPRCRKLETEIFYAQII